MTYDGPYAAQIRPQSAAETDEEFLARIAERVAALRTKSRERERRKRRDPAHLAADRDRKRRMAETVPDYHATQAARLREWREAHPERSREITRASRSRRRLRPDVGARDASRRRGGYAGLTPEQVEALRERVGAACEVCGRVPGLTANGRDGLHIDHNHATGAIRGMVCGRCNRDLHAIDAGPDHVARLVAFAARSDFREAA